uniref:Transposase (Putative), gypsy type n=1 Tax=Tanacetum cinerariifolium TaxID=118510 RepID=A0A6L2NVR3_TANCI|nr:hypothetical protein [Tanacetum cinerariifolium]
MLAANTYSKANVAVLNTRQTPIQKQPETLLCLVGLSRIYFLEDDVYPTFLHDDDQGGAPNPTKVKTGLRPRASHEVPVFTVITSRVINMEDPNAATESFGTPSIIEKSRLRGGDCCHGTPSTMGGKYLASMGLEAGSTFFAPAPQETHADVSDSDPLSYAKPPSNPERPNLPIERPSREIQILRSLPPSPPLLGRGGPYSTARVFLELRHLLNDDFFGKYNINLVRQVAMGSQLRLRFEQDVRLRKRATERIAKWEQRIQVREEEIKKLDQKVQGLRNQTSNLKTLLKAEADMKKAAEAKNVDITKELESLCAQFSDLQIDARLDALSIDFDEELYPHMLTASAGRRWVIGHGLRLAVMKCRESLEQRKAFTNVVSAGLVKGMSEGPPRAERSKVPISGSVGRFKGCPNGGNHGVRDPRDPWAIKGEILLEDAIAANVSRAEKKKKCRLVCRTHGVGSTHNARSDGVPVSVPTVAPQGLAILLADATTQTETFEDDASPRLLRSKSLPPMYNLDWP